MLRGNRVAFCASVGWLILAGAAPPHKQEPAANPKQHVSKLTASIENYSAYPDRNSDRCYSDKNHERADLCAQWRAAIAAEKASQAAISATDIGYVGNWISGFGAVLSFISIILVLCALKVALQANDITRDTARRQLRAYLNTTGVWFDTEATQVRLCVCNRGQTPAYDVVVKTISRIKGGKWSVDPHNFGIIDPQSEWIGGFNFPGLVSNRTAREADVLVYICYRAFGEDKFSYARHQHFRFHLGERIKDGRIGSGLVGEGTRERHVPPRKAKRSSRNPA